MPRKIIPERKIELDANCYPVNYPILEVVDMRKWDKLVTFPEESSSIILKEFCANVDRETVDDTRESWVRGKKVFFFPAAIERFLKTSYRLQRKCEFRDLYNKMQPTEHKRMYSEEMPELADQIRQGISCLYSSWVTKKGQPLAPEKIHKNHLTGEVVFWHHFINSTVMPSTHLTYANLERAILYYTLLREGNLNISRILSDEIVAMVLDGNVNHRLAHSSLITHLCIESGVEIPEGLEKDVKLDPTLKSSHYEEYVRVARKQTVVRASELSQDELSARSPRGEPRAPQVTHREAESFVSAPLPTDAASSSRSRAQVQSQEDTSARLARIERRLDRHDRRHTYEISMLEALCAQMHVDHLVLRPESPPSPPLPQPEEPAVEPEDTSSSSDDGDDDEDAIAADAIHIAPGEDADDTMDE